MPYPPADPAANKAGNTPTTGDHAGHHNDLANAVASIVDELGAGPKGGEADLTARLAGVDDAVAAEVVARDAAIAAHSADTTAVHGIADTALLETQAGAQVRVDAAIAALLDSAPGTLDTLNELAAALADDPDFATTMTNALAGKQPLNAGLTAIAALATTAFGRDLLTLADVTALNALLLGDANLLAAGEEVLNRATVTGSSSLATGVLRLTYFTARKSETTTQVRVITAGTAAGATPTLCRIGLFAVAGNGDLTLVAATANDTSLFAAANTMYTKSWTTPYAKVRGQRYAWGPLIVTAAAAPTLMGLVLFPGVGTPATAAPRLAGQLLALADLPGTVAAASVANSGTVFYSELLP